jgi:hypothetical protein
MAQYIDALNSILFDDGLSLGQRAKNVGDAVKYSVSHYPKVAGQYFGAVGHEITHPRETIKKNIESFKTHPWRTGLIDAAALAAVIGGGIGGVKLLKKLGGGKKIAAAAEKAAEKTVPSNPLKLPEEVYASRQAKKGSVGRKRGRMKAYKEYLKPVE